MYKRQKVILSNENTQLFVFTDIAGFNQFFSMSEPSTTAGFTFQVPGFATTYVNTVTVINGQTLDETYVREFTIHEIGHAIDYAITISGTSPYLKYVKNDFVHLDYVVVGADKASSSLRSACGPAGPFTNVVDNNNVPVCDVNVLRPDLAGKTNSQILFTLTPYFFTPSQNPTEYLELFAQLYAYKAYSNQLDPLDLPAKTADGLFHNPFFECAGSYAAVYTGGNTSAPTYCDVVPPAWYIPGQ